MVSNIIKTIKTYYRLTKPGIIYGNIMTAAAGFLFASKGNIDFLLLIQLLAGMSLVIASACVFNNYFDRDIDKKMARTKNRAIASGEVSAHTAIAYASVLGILGISILIAFTNYFVVAIGLIAHFSYVVIYGITKRRSIHGTLVGTLPGGASLVAGHACVSGGLGLESLILFLIMLGWQMAHFYSIAIFRLQDYKAAHLPVMPAVVGSKNTKLQIMFYIFVFVIATGSLNILDYAGKTYAIVVGTIGLAWLWKAVGGFDTIDDTPWARKMFGFSLIVLLVFSAMISLDNWLP